MTTKPDVKKKCWIAPWSKYKEKNISTSGPKIGTFSSEIVFIFVIEITYWQDKHLVQFVTHHQCGNCHHQSIFYWLVLWQAIRAYVSCHGISQIQILVMNFH